jgi:Tol biopolymer transport system component
MSPDGRWAAFRGGYVGVHVGPAHRVPGAVVWASSGHLLAVVTTGGGVELGPAAGPLRRLLPDGWGASTAAFSPDDRHLAVSRTDDRGRVEEVWLIDLPGGSRRALFREPSREGAPLLLQGFSPNGRWLLFWKDPYSSASILADGVPLLAIAVVGGSPRIVAKGELHYRDFLGWCGGSLAYVTDHGGRVVTHGDGIAVAAPAGWRSRTILPAGGSTSWTSLSCDSSGTLAVAAGPSSDDEPFGHEHRSIWLVRGRTATHLAKTTPPPHRSDEWPSWSADGRWLLFVRSRFDGRGWMGSLFAFEPATGKLLGPIARVGATQNYYGHYDWASQISWHRP